MALTDKLSAIGNAIREKTGKTDLIKLEDMPKAIAAITTQGGGAEGLKYDIGEFVLDSDTTGVGSVVIPHNLGKNPGVVIVWTEDFNDLNAETPIEYTNATNVGYIWIYNLFGLPQRLTSTVSTENGIFLSATIAKESYVVNIAAPTSKTYVPSKEEYTETTIPLQTVGNSNYWRAGITYRYFVADAWWEVTE